MSDADWKRRPEGGGRAAVRLIAAIAHQQHELVATEACQQGVVIALLLHRNRDPLGELRPVTDVATVAALASGVRDIFVHHAIKD